MTVDLNQTYLSDMVQELKKTWPDNRTVNIVCHGHSVPSGYFATPFVDTFHAYPHLLHSSLKQRFPFAVMNVIVSGIGGEDSAKGMLRFRRDVLDHHPDLVTIDYGLNDRRIGLENSNEAWNMMIDMALEENIKILLLTPSPDYSFIYADKAEEKRLLLEHAHQIRRIAKEKHVGLVDVLAAFEKKLAQGEALENHLSWSNHPNHRGHGIIAQEIVKWFPL